MLRLVANGTIGIVTARGLGALGRGIFALLVTFNNTLASLGLVGLGPSGVYHAGKDKFPAQETVSTALTAALLTGAGSALLGVAAVFSLRQRLFGEIPLVWVFLVVAMAPIIIASTVGAYLLLGFGRVKPFNWSQSAGAGLELGLLVVFLLLGLLNPWSATSIWAAAFLGAAIYTVVKLRRFGPLRPGWRPAQLREMLGFGLKSYLGDSTLQMNMRFDFLLVKVFAGTANLGYYSISALISQLPWIFPHGLSYALYPRVTSLPLPEAVHLTEKGMRHAFSLSLLTGVFIALTARYLVPVVFGRTFSASVTALLVLLPGAIFFGLTWLQAAFLIGQCGKPLKVGYAYLFTLVANIALNVLLTPRYGILGAAAASSLARLAGCVFLLQMVTAESKSSWRSFLLPRRGDMADLIEEIRQVASLVLGKGRNPRN